MQYGADLLVTSAVEAALLDIATRASSVVDRIRHISDEPPIETPAESDPIDARMDVWRRASAAGDPDAFARRLAWDGLGLQSARRVMGHGVRYSADRLPEWSEVLREVLSAAGDASHDEPAGNPVPFEEFTSLFVAVAWRRLAGATQHIGPIPPPVAAAFDRDLLFALTRCAGTTLYSEFALARALRQPSLDWLVTIGAPVDSRDIYEDFVRGLRGPGLLAFFTKYPVLARLLSTTVILRIDAAAEFISRLAADDELIRQTFGGDSRLGQISTLQTDLSDPHRGQRRVFILTFTSGLRLLYKPKSLGTEDQFSRLLHWLATRDAPSSSRPLRVLDRGAYGWSEFVEQRECADVAAAERYYQRLGALLCLLYVLECTDCHYENVVAAGEFPILIDAETLLHPRTRNDDAEFAAAQHLAADALGYSVLRVGLLPSWQAAPDGLGAVDVGGLAIAREQRPGQTAWRNVNTDAMTVEQAIGTSSAGANVPTIDGVPLRAENYAAQVASGFEATYRFLAGRRDELLTGCEPLDALLRERVRWVYRPTQSYGMLLDEARQPKYMRDGADRGILFDRLAPPLTDCRRKPALWPLLADEQEALEHGDVPLFVAHAATDALQLTSGIRIEKAFVAPSAEIARNRIRQLNERDLRLQLEFIRCALEPQSAAPRIADGVCTQAGEPLRAQELVEAAEAIRDLIVSRAVIAADGSMTWIGPQAVGASERYRLEPVDEGLYDGAAGIALFLAALAKATGAAEDRLLAVRAVAPVLTAIRERPTLLSRRGIGLASGVSGIAYALTRIGQLLDDRECLRAASAAAALVTAERIAGDRHFDTLHGTAGSALALLAVSSANSDEEALSRAVACGKHLVESRSASSAGPRAWRTVSGRMLTGFAHGAAGIGYALARLAARTGEASFLEAARESADYEDSLFSSDHGNWPDLRNDLETYAVKWCHGAPGIGLARLGQIDVLDSPQLRRDISAAIDSIGNRVAATDHLCCGAMGHVDLLLEAGIALGRPDLAERAVAEASTVVRRAANDGRYRTPAAVPRTMIAPGLFSGLAGIGYELLRAAEPASLPSVLRFATE